MTCALLHHRSGRTFAGSLPRSLGLLAALLALLQVFVPERAAAQPVGYSATFGGAGSNTGFAVVHHDGFSYVAGRTTAADFPVTDGSTYRGDPGETGDIFVAKLDAQGQILAATLLGGSGPDFANGLVITDGPGVPDGNGGETFPKVITISGWTGSTDFRTLNPIQAASGGKTDCVIAQFDLNLKLLFSTYLGGAEDDQFAGLTPVVNNVSDDDLIFFGFTTSTNFPFPTPNAADPADTVKNLSANADGLLVRMNRNRTLPMASLFRRTSSGNGTQNEVILAGTSGMTFPSTLADPAQYAVYVTGWTDGDFFRHSSDTTGSGKRIFLTQIDPGTGGRLYSRVLGGSGEDIGQAVAITARGVVVSGQTTSTDLPHTRPLFQSAPGGGTDAVLVLWQHRDGGTPLFAVPPFVAYLGGSGEDSGRALAPAFGPNFPQSILAEHVHFSGVTGSTNLPLLSAPSQPPAQAGYGGGATDGFFGRLAVGPGLVLEAKNLTFAGGAEDDAFTGVAAVREDGTNFQALAVGAKRVAGAGLQGRAARVAGLAQAPGITPTELALAVFFGDNSEGGLPQLLLFSDPRGGLVPGQEERVGLVIRNQSGRSEDTVELLNIEISDLPLLSGAPTAEVLGIDYEGAPLPGSFAGGKGLYNLGRLPDLAPGEMRRIEVRLRTLPGALQASPQGVQLLARVRGQDRNERAVQAGLELALSLFLSPDLSVRLVKAEQDPPGVVDGRARYQFRVDNVGSKTSDAAEVVLTGTNLRKVTYQIDGGPLMPVPDLDGPGEVRVPVGPVPPDQGRDVRVEGEPSRPEEGTRLAGRASDPADTNTENNNAPGETKAGPAPDYAVEITSQTVGFETRSGAEQLVLRTVARLTLTLPDGLAPERVPPAVLTNRHAGGVASVRATPGNLGQCEMPDPQTTVCTFPATAFFQPGQTPGLILLEIEEIHQPATLPLTPTVALSVRGDGQDPTRPNNFASATQELAARGALRVIRSDFSARTVVGAGGAIHRIVTQRMRVRNDGPGSVSDVRLRILARYRFAPDIPAPLLEPPRVIAGAEAGVQIEVNSFEEIVRIQRLTPGAEVVIEFLDLWEALDPSNGTVLLETPPGANLSTSSAIGSMVIGRLRDPFLTAEGAVLRTDLAVQVLSQRIEIESREGGRVPVRVSEIEVSHRGTPPDAGSPVDGVELTLRGSGVALGGRVLRQFGSGATSSRQDVPGVSRPEAPANPNVIRIPLGRFVPGQTNLLILRDDVLEPGRDQVLGLSGQLTLPLFDVTPFNNDFTADFEYRGFQSTLDYSVFVREMVQEPFLDTRRPVPARVPAVRTRLELVSSGTRQAQPLPLYHLEITNPGSVVEVRAVAKSGNAPAPVSGLQCEDDFEGSIRLTCEVTWEVARDYFIETVSLIRPPSASQTVAVLADVTGDGETPRDDNNNRARRSLLYEPIRVVTRLENGEWVVEVIYAGEGVESPRVERSGALSGPWILIPIPGPVGEKVEIRLPLDSAQQFLRAVPGP